MIVQSGIVDAMSMRMNDSGVGGPSAPMPAGPVEVPVDGSAAGATARGGTIVDVVAGIGVGSVEVDPCVVDPSFMSLATVTSDDVGVAFDAVTREPHPRRSVSAVMSATVIDARRVRLP